MFRATVVLSLLATAVTLSWASAWAAGPVVTPIRRGTPHDALYAVKFEGQRGIAVGAFGAVLTTEDGGSNWQAQRFPMKHLALTSVAMREGRCIAVGQAGLIYTSNDCKTWQAAASPSKSRLLAVSLNRHGTAFAAGAFGTILKSTDWGKSWDIEPVDWKGITQDGAEPHLYDLHVADDGVVTAVGEFELVLRAKDAKQWTVLHKGERSLFGLFVLEGGRMYATGQSGALLSSGDGGASWQSYRTGTQAILTGIYATPQGQVVASGINTVIVSRDAGASWSTVQSELVRSTWYQALAPSQTAEGKRRLLAVGAGGSILEFGL